MTSEKWEPSIKLYQWLKVFIKLFLVVNKLTLREVVGKTTQKLYLSKRIYTKN